MKNDSFVMSFFLSVVPVCTSVRVYLSDEDIVLLIKSHPIYFKSFISSYVIQKPVALNTHMLRLLKKYNMSLSCVDHIENDITLNKYTIPIHVKYLDISRYTGIIEAGVIPQSVRTLIVSSSNSEMLNDLCIPINVRYLTIKGYNEKMRGYGKPPMYPFTDKQVFSNGLKIIHHIGDIFRPIPLPLSVNLLVLNCYSRINNVNEICTFYGDEFDTKIQPGDYEYSASKIYLTRKKKQSI